MSSKVTRVFHGTLVHSVGLGDLKVLPKHALGVTEAGVIAFVEPAADKDALSAVMTKLGAGKASVTSLGEFEFLAPGMIDTHAHAPQYRFAGNGSDLPLLDWLNTYTFPTEARFSDREYAKRVYERTVARSLRCGTTTCVYFATIHKDATLDLVDVLTRRGQRALVGKVNMDRNSPDFYVEDTKASLADTKAFIEAVIKRGDDTITPVITPRFAPSCTPELMRGLAELAKKHTLPIQSHVSENKAEIAWVRDLHPDCSSYTDVYEKHGLLTKRTILAHGCHLTDAEISAFARTGAGVSHCANSNFSLTSGVANVRKLLRAGVKVGLGTDMCGGYSFSMFDSVRQSLIATRVLQLHDQPASDKPLSWKELYHLATVGGAEMIGMADKLGNFVPGKMFDAILIDTAAAGGAIDVFSDVTPHSTLEDLFERFVFIGDDRNIKKVFVRGREADLAPVKQ